MSDDTLATQLNEFRQRRPDLALAIPYLDADRRDALVALAAIEQKWRDDVIGVTATHVLEAKLGWWGEEMTLARRGESRHPLSAALFALPTAKTLPDTLWLAVIDAAVRRRDTPPVGDFAAQVQAVAPFPAAQAALETALWFGPEADAAKAQRLATLGYLFRLLPHLGGEVMGDILPMRWWARHGLDREALRRDTPERDAAIRDQLGELAEAFTAAQTLTGPVSLFRGIDTAGIIARIEPARRDAHPLRVIAAPPRPNFKTMWRLWRHARHLRRHGLLPAN